MKAFKSVRLCSSTVQWRRFSHLAPRSPPVWWQQGWPRKGAGSVAEAELLAPLGELLMPSVPVREMFRSFKSPRGWGGNYLEPDLTAYGLFKNKNAALFVEYDGYYLHATKEGMERDLQKNVALLEFASRGSLVLRIGHNGRSEMGEHVLWASINTWRRGDHLSLSRALTCTLEHIVHRLQPALCPSVYQCLEAHLRKGKGAPLVISRSAQELYETAIVMGKGNTAEEIRNFLNLEGFQPSDIDQMQKRALARGASIEKTLQPLLQFLLELGLAKSQVAKAVATHPPLLRYNINNNLRPTVRFFLDLGLTKSQVAKAVATSPQILSLSIEKNLKPTVQWFLDLGLTKSQVAKAVARHSSFLWLSIEQNLIPTVQWLLDLGMTESQIAAAVAHFTPILWYSIENNLKPTVQWLLDLGLTESQIAKLVARYPPFLGLSIEQNLTPKVQWLLSLGLTRSEVAKAVADFPPIIGLSSDNLSRKLKLLQSYFTPRGAAKLIAQCPRILSYSQQRLEARLSILEEQERLSAVINAMSRTDEMFHQRFVAPSASQKGI